MPNGHFRWKSSCEAVEKNASNAPPMIRIAIIAPNSPIFLRGPLLMVR